MAQKPEDARIDLINNTMLEIGKLIQARNPTMLELGVIGLTTLRMMLEHAVSHNEPFPNSLTMQVPAGKDMYELTYQIKKLVDKPIQSKINPALLHGLGGTA